MRQSLFPTCALESEWIGSAVDIFVWYFILVELHKYLNVSLGWPKYIIIQIDSVNLNILHTSVVENGSVDL